MTHPVQSFGKTHDKLGFASFTYVHQRHKHLGSMPVELETTYVTQTIIIASHSSTGTRCPTAILVPLAKRYRKYCTTWR